MKKRGMEWVWMVVLALCLTACGDKLSAVEGKLVDGNGTPVAGIKIIASKVPPVNGHDQLETITKADGSFRLTGLFPASIYKLRYWAITSTANAPITIESAPPGQTSVLPKLMTIRFTALADGVIYDAQTDLDWLVGANRDTTFDQAQKWVASLGTTAGGGWGMPSQDELALLYQQGVGERNIDPLFKTTGWWVWAGWWAWTGEFDPTSSWRFGFSFSSGQENWNSREYLRDGRVFAVRSHLKQ
ncbi:MAG: hypothetical protein V2B19_29825 [Pseudomonadota bacterium]